MSPTMLLLAFVALSLILLLLAVTAKRKLRSEFPGFHAYLVCNAAAIVVFIVVTRWYPNRWEATYWTFTAASMLLSFWIFYEVFLAILKPYAAIMDLGKLLIRWATVFLLLAAMVTAVSTAGTQYTKICAVILLLERCVQLMQCGMLMLLLAFESRLGLSWRSHAMSIGLGVGIFSAWDLSITYAGGHFPAQQPLFDILGGLVSIGTYGFWMVAFLARQPQRKTVMDSPSRLIFQRWNEALMTTPLVARKHQVAFAPVESFLPGVEQTVERVMARKMMH